jgi:hypothetical protein
MAMAVRKPTPIKWVPLKEALKIAERALLSRQYAELWLREQLAAGQIRWQAKGVRPSDYPINEFWKDLKDNTINWEDNSADKRGILKIGLSEHYRQQGEPPVVPPVGVIATLYGIEVVREDVEALLRGNLGTLKGWLTEWAKNNPHKDDEQMGEYAAAARAAIRSDPRTADKEWRDTPTHSVASQFYKLGLGPRHRPLAAQRRRSVR